MSFKIFLIYHSHIDIGYTERQEVIADYQADFIKQAVDCALSDKQKKREENNKFRFTSEGFWSVEQYLNKYGDDGKKRLIEAIKSGYFEVTAGYLHFAELLDYENIKKACSFAKDFLSSNNLKPTKVAMSSDVNGMSHGFCDAFTDNGVKYLLTSINPHHGGPAFDKPAMPFYWKSSNGKKMLCWNGLPYHGANTLGIIPGMINLPSPSIPHGIRTLPTLTEIKSCDDYAKARIPQFIRALRRNGYKYDFIPVRGSALFTDNSPVSDEHCDLIKEWNNKYGDKIEIVTSTLQEFFSYLEDHADSIGEYEGEWNDWWTDGPLSTPSELARFRKAQRVLRYIRKIDPENNKTTKEELDELEKLLILYAEHTWGYSASFTAPFSLPVKQLDERKSSLAEGALELGNKYLERYPSKQEDEVKGKITYKDNIVDNNIYKIELDEKGVKSIKFKNKNFLNSKDYRLGEPIYQIFPNGMRELESGFGYMPRLRLKNKLYRSSVKNIDVKNEGICCKIAVDYKIEGTKDFKTVFILKPNDSKIKMNCKYLKTIEMSAEGLYVALPFHIQNSKWYLDKPNSFKPYDYQLPKTCADYYSCTKGIGLIGDKDAVAINTLSTPLVMFNSLNLWKFNKEPHNIGGTVFSWLTNNKWETNFRCQCSGLLKDEYIIEICNKGNCQSTINKNDKIF